MNKNVKYSVNFQTWYGFGLLNLLILLKSSVDIWGEVYAS